MMAIDFPMFQLPLIYSVLSSVRKVIRSLRPRDARFETPFALSNLDDGGKSESTRNHNCRHGVWYREVGSYL
jgi:hypothetical protein